MRGLHVQGDHRSVDGGAAVKVELVNDTESCPKCAAGDISVEWKGPIDDMGMVIYVTCGKMDVCKYANEDGEEH